MMRGVALPKDIAMTLFGTAPLLEGHDEDLLVEQKRRMEDFYEMANDKACARTQVLGIEPCKPGLGLKAHRADIILFYGRFCRRQHAIQASLAACSGDALHHALHSTLTYDPATLESEDWMEVMDGLETARYLCEQTISLALH